MPVRTPFRYLTLALMLLGLLLALPSPALAVEPTKTEFTFSQTSEVTDICDFPITLAQTLNVTETDFVDQSGVLMRIHLHVVEQDTFSANGKTLVGLPYTWNNQIFFDSSGTFTGGFGSGGAQHIVLPDGSHFVLAGRFDFSLHPGGGFVLVPDFGTPGDVAGFCAALAP
jgi:hypothetical protein